MAVLSGFRLTALCGLLTVLTAAPDADALTCPHPQLSAPEDGAADVPTNTLVWCGAQGLGGDTVPFVLEDASGAEVTGTSHVLKTTEFDVTVFVPDEPLSPDTTFSYRCVYDEWVHTFTTGAGPREETPAVPDPSRHAPSTSEDSVWGDSFGVRFEELAPANTLIVVDLNSGANLLEEDPSGSVAEIIQLELSGSLFVGNGPCGGVWPDAGLGATASFAFGAFDLTGTFSGWSDPVEVTLPETYTDPEPPAEDSPAEPSANDELGPRESSGSGCSLALGGGAHGWWMLPAVIALAARRPRRASRA